MSSAASGLGLSGLVSNIDTDALIQKLMALEAKPLQLLQNQQATLQDKSTAWRDINNRLANLQTQAANLADKLRFYTMKAVSSDTTVLDATTSTGAAAGSYSLNVQSLAQAEIVQSTLNVADPTVALNLTAGSPQINGKSIQVGATDSLNSIRDKINGTPGIGVNASVVQVAAGDYRLFLTSQTTGAAGMTLQDTTGTVLTQLGLLTSTGTKNDVQAGTDAVIQIGTASITQSTNTVTGVVPGVTLNLKKVGAATVTVGQDYDAVVAAVHSFVDQYNSAVDLLDRDTSWDPKTRKGGVLFGDPTVNQLKAQLRSLATNMVPGTQVYQNLSAIGITTGQYGTPTYDKLQIDDTKLRQALTTNLDAVGQLLGVNEANVALSSAGSTATASSTAAGFDPNNVLNGQTSSEAWGTPGVGWQDATAGTFPDTLTINFGTARTIDKLVLYTLDSATQPASTAGVRDYTVNYWDGANWKLLTSVSGNTQGTITSSFGPINTSQLQINITAANASTSNVVQVQAFEPSLGVAGRIRDFVQGYTASGTGLLDQTQKSLKAQMDDLGNSIQSMQDRLNLRQQTMRAQFTAMELAMSKLKNQSAALNSMLLSSGTK